MKNDGDNNQEIIERLKTDLRQFFKNRLIDNLPEF